MSTKPRILFACVANAGRSAASKVLAEYYGGDAVEVFSAGSKPGDHVHPEVSAVLGSLGLDTSGEVPKAFDSEATYDYVVTAGCGEECPWYRGARYEDWPLDDPKGQDELTVRRIIGDIDTRVRTLLGELVPDHELPRSVFEQTANR